MEKVLTISVAAYNVEKYIYECLDSLCIEELMDDIEVIVVNDGSTDSTLEIINKFQERWPKLFRVVNKENEGYGSTVNIALIEAQGRYFRLIDGDDWVDKKALIDQIEILKKKNIDVMVTNVKVGKDKHHLNIRKWNYWDNYICENFSCDVIPNISMPAITYRLDVIKKSNLVLPQQRYYTDQFYVTVPFSEVKSIGFFNLPIYCYRVGRNGQSISRSSRIKHMDDSINNTIDLINFLESNIKKENMEYLTRRIAQYNAGVIRTIMLEKPNTKSLNHLVAYDKKIFTINTRIYLETENQGRTGKFVKYLRKTNYKLYWILKIIPGGMPNWA